jgi:hypothetical protein
MPESKSPASGVKKSRVPLIFLLAGLLIFLAAAPAVGGWVIKKRIERRLDLKMTGDYTPALFRPVFYLHNVTFEWRDRIKFLSGNLEVRYNPVDLFSGSKLRVKLSGKDFDIELLKDWAKVQGVENAAVDVFYADLEFDSRGLREIHAVDVQSKMFQFKIASSEK